ncbi:hypothetical protein [Nostoc sp. CALU 1950]|uniref:hypothetical protein n=1 Tax=Nostoc sp. CALU 1950 TaxID=3104321 RepID=UPI003EB7AE15
MGYGINGVFWSGTYSTYWGSPSGEFRGIITVEGGQTGRVVSKYTSAHDNGEGKMTGEAFIDEQGRSKWVGEWRRTRGNAGLQQFRQFQLVLFGEPGLAGVSVKFLGNWSYGNDDLTFGNRGIWAGEEIV